jgi:hypothetical protein
MPRCLTTRTPTPARGMRKAAASSSAVHPRPFICGASSKIIYRGGGPSIKFILREKAETEADKEEKEHKARPSRLDLDQSVSTRCHPKQNQDRGSGEMDFRLYGTRSGIFRSVNKLGVCTVF